MRWQPGIDSSLYALLSPREVSVISAADGGEDAEGNSGAVVLRIPSNSAPRPSLGGGEDEGEEEEEVALSPPASCKTCRPHRSPPSASTLGPTARQPRLPPLPCGV